MVKLKKRKEIYKDILRLLLKRQEMCATLSDIARELNIDITDKNRLYVLYDTLSKLKKSELISSRWVWAGDKKFRLYCLKRT